MHPQANGDTQGGPLGGGKYLLGNYRADALGHLHRRWHIGIGAEHQELLSAKAGCNVVSANAGLQQVGHLLQDQVAHRVAIGVIDLLEVVHIQQDHAQRGLVALGLGGQGLHGFKHKAAVGQARQRVGGGQVAKLFIAHAHLAQHGVKALVKLAEFVGTVGVQRGAVVLAAADVAHALHQLRNGLGENQLQAPGQQQQAGKNQHGHTDLQHHVSPHLGVHGLVIGQHGQTTNGTAL